MTQKKPTDKQLVAAARKLYHVDGEIEVEPFATVSRSDDPDEEGAYVCAWVWVGDEDALSVNGLALSGNKNTGHDDYVEPVKAKKPFWKIWD